MKDWSPSKWLQAILIAALVFWLFLFPPTRMLIRFLLPLGSGWDDLVEVIAGIALVYIAIARGWIVFDLKTQVRNLAKLRSTRTVQVVVFTASVLALIVVPYTRHGISKLIVTGEAKPDLWLWLGLALIVNAVTWAILKLAYAPRGHRKNKKQE